MIFKPLAGMLKQVYMACTNTRSEHFAASGHTTAAPTSSVMNSRRFSIELHPLPL